MTTEDAFQAALDANPDDYITRLVFADWLEEHGDPRAEGYRAMGGLRLYPHFYEEDGFWGWWRAFSNRSHDILPLDWFKLIPKPGDEGSFLRAKRTRREAEDTAALAFAQLPAERRSELLAAGPLTSV